MNLPKKLPRLALNCILAALVLFNVWLLRKGPQVAEHSRHITQALAAGEKPEWWDDAAIGVHYGAWIGLGGWAVLLLTQRWWARPWKEEKPEGIPTSEPVRAWWFWPLLIFAVIVGLGMRLPLAGKSLWWDEVWAAQQAYHGKWKEDTKHPGALKFLAHDWKRCAFYYQKPTNHVPMSLAQKASLQLWHRVTKAQPEAFHDLVARVPSLLASTVAMILIACLLAAWGHAGAGVAAAMVLAVHPWAIRYGVDARAYALVIPLCLGGMLACTAIVRSAGRSVGAWIGFGLVEWLWLWAYPNALLDITALNLVTLVYLLKGQSSLPDRWTAWWRLTATNLCAALVLLQLFLPNLMQAKRWAGLEKDKHFLNELLLDQTASDLLAGMDHTVPGNLVEAAGIPDLRAHYMAATLLFVLVILAVAGRCRTLLKERPLPLVLPLSLVAASLLFAAITRIAESYFYPRFVIALLPCLLVLAVPGLHGTRWGRRTLPVLAGGLFVWVVWPEWVLLTTRPIEPLRNVAAFIQKDAGDTRPLIACYGLGREAMPLCEPHCAPAASNADLEALVQRAGHESRPMYAIYGYNVFNRTLFPEGFRILDDKALFAEVAAFSGIEPDFYFRVLKKIDAH